MPDGLLGIDPAQLNALVAQFGGSTVDEDKKQRMIMGLLGMSAGLLGNSRKPLGLGLAGGIEGGVQGYTQEQARQMATRASALNQASNMYGLANQADQFQQNQRARQVLSQAYANPGMPGSTPPQQAPSDMPPMDMGPPSPQAPPQRPQLPPQINIQNASPKQIAQMQADIASGGQVFKPVPGAEQPQAAPQAPSPTGPDITGPIVRKRAMSDQYRAIGDKLAQAGVPERAQAYYDMAEKVLPQIDKTLELMQNGQPVQVNVYKDGSREILHDVQPSPSLKFENTGGSIVGLDTRTGKSVGAPIPTTVSPAAAQSNALGWEHLTETKRHNAAIEGDPEQIESVAQSIANGKQAPLSAYSMSRPAGQAIMGRVMQINPDYNAQDYGTQQKALKDFATGKNGNTVRSLNVAIAHLDTASQLADALKNGNIQLVNKIGNAFGTATGNPAVTNLDTAKQVIGAEVVKAIVGAGGGVGDRDKAQAAFASANSPAQLAGAINTYKSLLGGQLGGLRQQYETTTGRKDFDKFLSASTQTQLGVASGGDPGVRAAADRILQGN